MSFPDILRNDYLDHFNTFGENFDFDTFKNDTFEKDTFESIRVDRHPHDGGGDRPEGPQFLSTELHIQYTSMYNVHIGML